MESFKVVYLGVAIRYVLYCAFANKIKLVADITNNLVVPIIIWPIFIDIKLA